MLDSLTYHRRGSKEAEKLHDWNIRTKSSSNLCEDLAKPLQAYKRTLTICNNPVTWTVGDLAKAGSLLHVPQIGANFDDEQEMRRVYTLIYDVFRYKSILMQALNDINFFQIYEKLEKSAPIVWLLFYDLQHRAFKKREAIEQRLASKLFQYAKMTFAENALWCQRIKLAAAVSRIRIKHNALALSELLPAHLRNDRIARAAARSDGPLTVWVNNKKFKNNNDIIRQIEHTLKLKYVEDAKDLGPENFKWDRHCPLTIAFHCSMRQEVAQSSLVKTHKLIVQDRSFCLGPATFWKVVEDLQLCGNVVQTHVNSPRATAYLAILLSQNEKISKLMAFSAGKRKTEYESYLNKLGMTNVEVYSDKLVDLGQESAILEEVVAVYATPPNSYSAVNDPVDLVCSRGGDLSMLEILTESEDSIEGRNRVTKILEEQRKTLKFAMSRPQIQVVLYETHSELDIENTEMVNKSINDINKIAKLHHASLQGLITDLINDSKEIVDQGDGKEINNNDENNGKGDSINSNDERSINVNLNQFNQQDLQKVKVPDTDLFDSPELPSLCPNTNECLNTGGCYLALLQRKQVIRLDNKYMIQMAEQRGLFGTTSNNSLKSKLAKQQRKKYQQPKIEVKPKRSRKKFKEIEETLGQVDFQKLARLRLKLLNIYKQKKCESFSELMQEYHAMGTTEDRCFLYFNNENDVGQNNGKTDNEIVLKAGGLLGHLSISQIKNLVSSSFKIGHNNDFFKCSNDIIISNPRTAVKDERNQSLETLVEEKNVNQIINKFTENSNNCDKKPKNNTWTSNRNKRFFQLTQIKQQLKLNQRLNYEKKMRLLEKKIMKDRTKFKNKNQSENQKNNDKENVSSPRTIVLRTKKGPLNIYYTNNGSRTRSVSLIRPRNVSILESAGSFNVKAGTGKLYELDGIFDGINKGKINGDAINRIANPTEAFKVKTMNEDLLPSPQSTIRGTMTRDFICEMCKKRHTR